MLDLMTIDYSAKETTEPAFVQDKIDVGRFGVGGHSQWLCFVPLEKGSQSGDQMLLQLRAHHLPVKLFLRCPVRKYLLVRE